MKELTEKQSRSVHGALTDMGGASAPMKTSTNKVMEFFTGGLRSVIPTRSSKKPDISTQNDGVGIRG